MITIEKLLRKTLVSIALCLSFVVSANTHTDVAFGNANTANSFNIVPNMMAANNWSNYTGTNNWQPYNNTNMMQMMGGSNMAYNPYNAMMPFMPNNNWMSGGNNNWGSFGAYNNMMPMMGVNGAMPYTNYNAMMTSNLGVDQTSMNVGYVSPTSTPEPSNAWGSLDANAAWGLGGNVGDWTGRQPRGLSSQDPADVIAQLMSGEHAAVYQKIIADAYEKGFADAMAQSGSGGICMPNTEELPEFSLDSE